MYKLLARSARPWLLVVLFALIIGLFIVLRGVQGNIAHLPGLAIPVVIPDAQFYYSAVQLVANLDSLGQAGRAIYAQVHLIDTVIPLGYGLLFALLIVYFWGIRGGAVQIASLLIIFPVAGALSDYIENITVEAVSALFAQGNSAVDISASHPFAASLAGYATAAKWMFSALAGIMPTLPQQRWRFFQELADLCFTAPDTGQTLDFALCFFDTGRGFNPKYSSSEWACWTSSLSGR